ncbi:MAG: hypothetical protein NUW37_14005 [Planctomycetes bacterium]|nr:hypothetical protein [Planctomycetota bacterium]
MSLRKWSPRWSAKAIEFQNKLWLFGGLGYEPYLLGDVWSSTDGDTWTFERGWTPWGLRTGYSISEFNGRLWLTGGNTFERFDGNKKCDVWSSPDGIHWMLETANAPWSAREEHNTVAFRGRLWLFGGLKNIYFDSDDRQVVETWKDAWSTEDGVNWRCETESLPWSLSGNETVVEMNGALYAIGSDGYDDSHRGEVWRSFDGITWEMPQGEGKFIAEAEYHELLSYDGKLWIIGWATEKAEHSMNIGNYIWSSKDGIEWELVSRAPWDIKFGFSCAVFKGRIWSLGGRYYNKWFDDVWSTTDGKTWTPTPSTKPWLPRTGHGFLSFRNKLWILGGYLGLSGGDDKYFSEVWSSIDGKDWKLETDRAPWGFRHGFEAIVFKNRLWILGGFESEEHIQERSSHGDFSYTKCFRNDVWSSVDGVEWRCETESAPWTRRRDFNVVLFNEKLWIIGGYEMRFEPSEDDAGTDAAYRRLRDQSGITRDVWSSSDGVHWKLETDNTPWEKRVEFATASFKGRLWIYGGRVHVNDQFKRPEYVNDVWSSSDGRNWSLVIEHADWEPCRDANGVVFDNRLWIAADSCLYSSADGRNWKEENYGPLWDRSFGIATWNDGIWIAGGFKYGEENDVWSYRRRDQ